MNSSKCFEITVAKKTTITARYEFYQCRQKSAQSIKEFVVEIKKLASQCDFKAFFKEALRDKMVSGMTEKLTVRLLAEGDDHIRESSPDCYQYGER